MLIPCTLSHNYYNYRQFKDMVWNMLPKRVARYLRRGRNYAEPFGQASRASAALGGQGGALSAEGEGGGRTSHAGPFVFLYYRLEGCLHQDMFLSVSSMP